MVWSGGERPLARDDRNADYGAGHAGAGEKTMKARQGLLIMLLVALAVWPAAAGARAPFAHAAATCSGYGSQQAAQNAADSRDPDHDHIFCEDNPCPCSSAWHAQHDGDGGSSPSPPRHHLRLGRSVAFARHVRSSGCHLRDHRHLPDARCTPGAYYKRATRPVICRSGYSSRVRHVTDATKDAVYRAYGIRHHSRSTYEIDHLVPLELGGSNARANLFPEPAKPRPGFHQKDRLENWTHDRVCSGARRLRATQRRIARNWLKLYRSAF